MSAKLLTRMTKVTTERHVDDTNALLKDGWRLIAVESVPVNDGIDSYVETKFVLGYPGQPALDD
ncbi:hypothetical protein ABQW67_19705 [Xanthomonas hortorum]|uniref:hypothetical protein n=1 Tax=Xanthomonas hortorum TaxID=56454 RepID=UPI0015D5E024|nr:hypothetical protein [Xanthomonas hortorum]MCE4343949.1 hypothetical protein [Xanthomonas hortorum pv. vitians]NMI20081.1 hypothetical protein [Xanthomonas hortorum pv. vitians]